MLLQPAVTPSLYRADGCWHCDSGGTLQPTHLQTRATVHCIHATRRSPCCLMHECRTLRGSPIHSVMRPHHRITPPALHTTPHPSCWEVPSCTPELRTSARIHTCEAQAAKHSRDEPIPMAVRGARKLRCVRSLIPWLRRTYCTAADTRAGCTVQCSSAGARPTHRTVPSPRLIHARCAPAVAARVIVSCIQVVAVTSGLGPLGWALKGVGPDSCVDQRQVP